MTTRTRKNRQTAKTVARQFPGLAGVSIVKTGTKSSLKLRAQLGMPRDVFCRLVNVSGRTIAAVESGKKRVAKLQRPYNEVGRLYAELSEVIQPDSLGEWFVTPNDAFGGFKPIEIIERGEIGRLWEMAYRLRSGMPG